MSKIRFRPVQGPEEKIKEYPQSDGYFYVATDTGRVYLDTATENKMPIGSSGVQVIYGTDNTVEIEYDADENPVAYLILLSKLSITNCHIDDLILNLDGCFYRILGFALNENREECARCEKLTVAGAGGGGEGDSEQKVLGTVSLTRIPSDSPVDILNEENVKVKILVKCRTVGGVPQSSSVQGIITISEIKSATEKEVYYTSPPTTYEHNVPQEIDLTNILRNSCSSEINFSIYYNPDEENNRFQKNSDTININKHHLSFSWKESSFSNDSPIDNGQISVSWLMSEDIARSVEVYFDDYLVLDRTYSDTDSSSEDSFVITPDTNILGIDKISTLKNYFTHGEHIIKAKLYLMNNSKKGAGTDFIQKEIVIQEPGNKMPLIWVQDFKTEYYTYETIRIPFKVLDPNNNGAFITLYKNGVQVGTRELDSSQVREWQYWEITNLTVDDSSYYTIKVGTDPYSYSRNFNFTILIDPLRDMKLAKKDNLKVNFIATGRSNSEGKLGRETYLINNDKYVEFKNFNWYNNGWIFDENNTTCLRVSNGAEVSIPVGKMAFKDGSSSATIEVQFKIKNPQNYAKVITKYTRYKVSKDNWEDDDAWDKFKAQNKYLNYDEFLTKEYLPTTNYSYDDLEYNKIEQDFNLKNLVCAYGKLGSSVSPGIYFSPQDAVFTANGAQETVSVDFIENEMLNLSFVYTKKKSDIEGGNSKLLEIFMNGVLTSVVRCSSDVWNIDSDSIKFMSNTCDIDIYSIRVYDTDLTIPEIVQNYAFDKRSIKQWDQKDLYENNTVLKDDVFSYTKMKKYNDNHPTDPLMPYIILRTTKNNKNNTDNRLPYSKAKGSQEGTLEFVNTALDAAYNSGELEKVAIKEGWKPVIEKNKETGLETIKYTAVQNYYIHHCPSFITVLNGCTFQVQGTSSQFYPRRNYKAKCKESMLLNRGPFAEEYKKAGDQYNEDITKHPCYLEWFYMDNKTVGTTKFTLKIDFMESSGDYNRGFANLVNEIYSKHPVEDYKDSFDNYNLYGNLEDYRTSVKGFPVLAFHYMSNDDNTYSKENSSNCIFIGKYNMLLDKGSDECYGFKPDKKVLQNQINGTPKVRDIAECWEFQNNSRTYCSFRDPWNRYKLSFRNPNMAIPPDGDNPELVKGAPKVVDSFEPRYNPNDDLIAEQLFNLKDWDDPDGTQTKTVGEKLKNVAPDRLIKKEIIDEITGVKSIKWIIKNPDGEEIEFNVGNNTSKQELLLALMSNWEDAVSWVWSTCLDCGKIEFEDGQKLELQSMGTYTKVEGLAAAIYTPNEYYIEDGVNEDGKIIYKLASEDYNPELRYYKQINENNKVNYISIKLTNDLSKVYKTNTYYLLVDSKNEIYVLSSDKFNSSLDYYSFVKNEDLIDERWKLPKPVTYDSITYTKDSKEYRQAKFKNELSNFFDIEYLASYLLMTEIFECYDSRGKNAMFASWGPQKGNVQKSTGKQHYIWYPIFYDIDTQLGINNTGIPSFEYYIDATEEGSFSTNDSVLWNNFYTFFKSKMVDKYKQLMGTQNNSYSPNDSRVNKIFTKGAGAGAKKSDIVDKWYRTDPSVFLDSYAALGDRPIIALSLDEEFKYIIPTNSKAENMPVFGRLTDGGSYEVEDDKYFYALQGDRNLYRAQFLANRLNYIDSWLTVGTYARNGGGSYIRSRISANNPKNTSDKWIEGTNTQNMEGLITNSQYWKNGAEFEEKNHMFDGEYWINMEPARNAYVTIGTDGENFPSKKYNGLEPVKYVAPDIKKGIMSSGNYKEQLYYIYGMDQMKSLGDLSKLYFQEFAAEGKMERLTDLLLGYDGKDESGNEYFNNDVNDWSFPKGGMPLLKEMNLCNINFKKDQGALDLTKSEKLENFRNTKSNIPRVNFAPGVALNTLYLTNRTNYLSLIEANLLTKLITNYVYPKKNPITGKLEILEENRGLYIQGLTDAEEGKEKTEIRTFDIRGGNLGYNSYKLLRKYISASKNSKLDLSNCIINLNNVQWSPYRLLTDTKTTLDPERKSYYRDNGHFQLVAIPKDQVNKITKSDIKNNQIYYLDTINGDNNNHSIITDYNLLIDIYNNYRGLNTNKPEISGVMYIKNNNQIDESIIQNELQDKYPDLIIFVENVKQECSAKFILEKEDIDGVLIQEVLKTQKLPLSSSKFFDDPTNSSSETYISFGSLQEKMPTYDFKGWEDDTGELVITVGKNVNEEDVVLKSDWNSLSLQSDKMDYVFKARFERKSYTITFVNGDRIINDSTVKKVFNYGEKITVPEEFYYFNNTEVSDLPEGEDPLEWTWRQTGWADKDGVKIDLTKQLAYADREFYAIGEPISVYDNILTNDATHKYYDIINSDGELSFVMTDLAKNLKGKITLPTTYNGQPITRIKYSQVNPSAAVGIQVNPNITAIFFAPKDSNKISVIDDYAFILDSGLEYFQFSDCLKKIGTKAFYQCPLSRNNIIPYSSSTEGLTFGAQAFYQSKMGSYSPYNLIIEGCKDGILNFDINAFSGQTILNMSGNQFKGYTGAIQVQIGTNKHPIKQITADSSGNIFTPRQTGMPTVANGYTGRFRYYYVASYGESIKNTLHNIYEAMISNRANFEEEPIVK